MHRPSRWLLAIALLLLSLLSSSCAVGQSSQETTATGTASPVRELRSIDQLKTAFNDGAGAIRLVLLISPT